MNAPYEPAESFPPERCVICGRDRDAAGSLHSDGPFPGYCGRCVEDAIKLFHLKKELVAYVLLWIESRRNLPRAHVEETLHGACQELRKHVR